MSRPVELSIVCRVGRDPGDLRTLHREYAGVVQARSREAEFIYLLEGTRREEEETLLSLDTAPCPVRVLRMARNFGEAAVLQYGFGLARGRFVITIPDTMLVDPGGVEQILEQLDQGMDVVVTRREPRAEPWINRLQSSVFHRMVHRITRGPSFHDITCGLRGLRTEVAQGLDLYGDLHRFIPVLALRRGFRTVEIPVQPRMEVNGVRMPSLGVYARRLLDLFNVFFLSRFTRKPLRFFGLIGMILGALGTGICTYLAVQRILRISPLANRPLLLLGVLLIVVGVQLGSIGLLGEIIIFLSSKRDEPEVRELTRPNSEESNR